jgi:hypothetical protein
MNVFYRNGEAFARFAIAKALLSPGMSIDQYMRNRWGVKQVPAGATSSETYEGLVADDATIEFWAAVAERSVIGAMGVREAPFRTRLLTPTTGPTASWTAEGASKACSAMSFAGINLDVKKVCSLQVLTEELLVTTTADAWLRGDMLRAVAAEVDRTFLDPAGSGDSVTPTSVTYGVSQVEGTSNRAASLAALIDDFAGDLVRAYIVGHPTTLAGLSGVNYPMVGARGGELVGIPALATRSCPDSVLVLIDPDGLAVAGGAARIRTSREGAVEMTDTPTQASNDLGSPNAPTPSNVVSLWQTNSVGILAEVAVNFAKVRTGSVSVLDVTAWAAGSPE